MPCNAMQCILYKIYFWKGFSYVLQIDMHLICAPMLTKFYSCKKWVLQHLTNHLHYMLENFLVNFLKTLNPSAYSGSIYGTPQAPSSLAQHEALENPPYGMLKIFTPSQAPPVISTLPLRPETAMISSPPIVETLNSIPSSATTSQTVTT
jgi:hypothetical protein